MSFQQVLSGERLAAHVTIEWSLFCVRSHMAYEVVGAAVLLLTYSTLIRAGSGGRESRHFSA